MAVKKGDKVKVEYTGTFDNGEVFDSSEKHGQPLEFEVGAKQVIPGFENALIGMELGEEKEITLKPEEAYGDINPDLVKEFPRSDLPQDMKVEEGSVLMITLGDGMQLPAKVKKLTDDKITLDLNHPLAGKTLHFKIKLVA